MKHDSYARTMALGGIFAALAVTVMSMGTIIPVATYVCPVICMLLLQVVLDICGKRIAWSWYGAVSVLSLLMAPDKESAVVFCFLGCYPILKSWIEKRKWRVCWKLLYFNISTLAAYWFMLQILGLEQVVRDIQESGVALIVILLLLGNITFFLVDRLLSMGLRIFRRG